MADDTPFDPLNRSAAAFDDFLLSRTGDLGYKMSARNMIEVLDRAKDFAKFRNSGGRFLDPRPGANIEDQRGMTLPELDLQARYLWAKGGHEIPYTPFDPHAATPPIPAGGPPLAEGLAPPHVQGPMVPEREKVLLPSEVADAMRHLEGSPRKIQGEMMMQAEKPKSKPKSKSEPKKEK